MQTKTINLYTFDELSDSAKQTARAWFRETEEELQTFADAAIDHAERVAALLGVTFGTLQRSSTSGRTFTERAVYWSGFSSQGDGASFDGDYRNAPDAPAKVRECAPEDSRLHGIADALAAVQARHGGNVTAHCELDRRSHYVHAYCMRVDAQDANGDELPRDDDKAVTEALRDFANWIYRALEREYEERMSDDSVDEMIMANEYTFRANGKREDLAD